MTETIGHLPGRRTAKRFCSFRIEMGPIIFSGKRWMPHIADLLVGGKDDLGPPQLTPDGLSALYVVFPSSGKATDNSRLMRDHSPGGSFQLALEEPGIGGYKCARLPSTLCIYSRIDNGMQRFFTFDPAGGKVKELLAAKRPSDDGPGQRLEPFARWQISGEPQVAAPYEAVRGPCL